MKIVGMTALLYGTTYLKYAIQSIIDVVDEHYILYCPHPSHGYNNGILPPASESEDNLHQLAYEAAGKKLRWIKGDWQHEDEQRNSIFYYAPDSDAIIIVDSDEVYEDGLALQGLVRGLKLGTNHLRIPFCHLWRSFKRGFAHDPAYPTRMVFPKQSGAGVELPTDKVIWHFGYAQPSEIVRFKMQNHGHWAEFRRDVNWFSDVFMANRQYDCHPIGSGYWNCEDIDQSKLPSVLKNHPLRSLDIIP